MHVCVSVCVSVFVWKKVVRRFSIETCKSRDKEIRTSLVRSTYFRHVQDKEKIHCITQLQRPHLHPIQCDDVPWTCAMQCS